MNEDRPLTTDELDAELELEPWLSAYLEPGDTDLDAARLRFETDQLTAARALRSAGVHVAQRLTRGELLTTACDRPLVR
jgi:hypothetical protein